MKERVDRMGGKIIIRTKQSVGTQIIVALKHQSPLKSEKENKKAQKMIRVLVADDHTVVRDGLVATAGDCFTCDPMVPLISFQMRFVKYCMFLLATRMSFSAAGQELLPDDSKDSAANRWLNKKVIASRVLDDMESATHWTAFST